MESYFGMGRGSPTGRTTFGVILGRAHCPDLHVVDIRNLICYGIAAMRPFAVITSTTC